MHGKQCNSPKQALVPSAANQCCDPATTSCSLPSADGINHCPAMACRSIVRTWKSPRLLQQETSTRGCSAWSCRRHSACMQISKRVKPLQLLLAREAHRQRCVNVGRAALLWKLEMQSFRSPQCQGPQRGCNYRDQGHHLQAEVHR
jgi:hypothetical protein